MLQLTQISFTYLDCSVFKRRLFFFFYFDLRIRTLNYLECFYYYLDWTKIKSLIRAWDLLVAGGHLSRLVGSN